MNSNLINLSEKLQWFQVAYSRQHRIKLSFAKKVIEQALEYSLNVDEVYQYLMSKRYRYIDIDLELIVKPDIYKSETWKMNIQSSESGDVVSESEVIKPLWLDLDDIDDVLSKPFELKADLMEVSLNNRSSYQMNDYMLSEFKKNGNKLLRDRIVIANMSLVYSETKRLIKYMNHDLSEEDLYHEGMFGLIKAIERFDSIYGGAFSTYAVYWIRQCLIRSMINLGTTVRIPVHLIELIRKIKKIEAEIIRVSENKPSMQKVIEVIGISESQYRDAKLAEHRYLVFTSLNQYVGMGEESETELFEFVSNDYLEIFTSMPVEFSDPYELVERNVIRKNIDELLGRLKRREREILEYRFGLLDGNLRTLEEVGRLFGLTRERIRQIESKAIQRLRAFNDKEKKFWIS